MSFERTATAILLKRIKGFPVVAVTGPRQSGKTTLVKTLFNEKPYISLEDMDNRAFAQQDPRGFLAQFPDGAILDEVQRVPDLFSYLQTRVDTDGRMGLFILTGSQQFGLLSNITQSLAGRVSLPPHYSLFPWKTITDYLIRIRNLSICCFSKECILQFMIVDWSRKCGMRIIWQPILNET